MVDNPQQLTTETINDKTKNIDQLDTLDIVKVINEEDKTVANAVEAELPQIAKAIDAVAERFQKGGRIIYCGAGSSGRMGTLDAVELTPTYSVPPERAFGLMAGGEQAMYQAIEGAEDSEELAVEDLKKVGITENDCVIGIAASGRTPYTIAALRYANEMGALSVSISCNRDSAMSKVAQISIAPVVGPEVISGSTRMKAGTAQKMIVNMLSTGVMVRIGKVYQNYMVHVQPTNKKLVARACNMITQLTNVDLETTQKYLKECDMKVATAIVMILAACSKEQANQALAQCQGHVRKAIESLTK